MGSAAIVRDESDKMVVGKTIGKVIQQQFGFRFEFTDGTACEVWSNPDDEILLKMASS